MISQTYRMGELFSGPGGMALGARLAAQAVEGVALQHAWANDYDLDTCKTYKRNILVLAFRHAPHKPPIRDCLPGRAYGTPPTPTIQVTTQLSPDARSAILLRDAPTVATSGSYVVHQGVRSRASQGHTQPA